MKVINFLSFFSSVFLCFFILTTTGQGVCSASELQQNINKSNSAALILQDIPSLSLAPVRPISSTSSPLVTTAELPCWKTDAFKNRCERIFNAYGSLDIFFEILGHRMENEELRWACMFILAYREQKGAESLVELFQFNPRADFDTCFDAYQRRKDELASATFNGAESEDENTNIAEYRANWVSGWLKLKKHY